MKYIFVGRGHGDLDTPQLKEIEGQRGQEKQRDDAAKDVLHKSDLSEGLDLIEKLLLLLVVVFLSDDALAEEELELREATKQWVIGA